MVTRKADTPQRRANRKYEEKNKDKRREQSGNFQTMIPRELFEEINAFLKENNITKVELIRAGYQPIKRSRCSCGFFVCNQIRCRQTATP